jgi:penicillin-binding protein 1C
MPSLPRFKFKTFFRRVFLWGGLCGVILLAVGLIWLVYDLPSIDNLSQKLNTPAIRITDRNGQVLYDFDPSGSGRQTSLALKDIPLALQQATIATEDQNFYQNSGVDISGIARAIWINLRGDGSSGGSTITQQLARTLLLSDQERSERSPRRKIREWLLAWQLAQHYSKEQILALYLNQMPYGAMAYGVEAASWTYFSKPASALDLAECALLAGLPQAPAYYDPLQNPEAARKRQAVVLGLMEKQGYITPEQRQLAEKETMIFTRQPYPLLAPHFVFEVRSQISQLFSSEEIRANGGLLVRTTLDLNSQHTAEQAVTAQIEELRLKHNLNNAAVVALNPHTGDILAMVGSPDYFDTQHSGAINMAVSPRQPGSALKPFIYAAAFDPSRADAWGPGSMILDVVTNFRTHEGKIYTPVNYDALEHGPVLVRDALGSSLNIPAVITLDHIGISTLFNLLADLGVHTLGQPDQYDLSIALGGGEVRLLDLTAAYGALASGGYRVNPRMILEVRSPQGKVLYTPPEQLPQRVLDPRVVWLISDILSDDDARIVGFGRNSMLRLDRPAAVKTGTTTNFHDNWTMGYTPDLVIGVWAGNADHSAMKDITGLTGAAPIWHATMRGLLSGKAEHAFKQPEGLTQVEICALSGLLPTDACPYRRYDWFITGHEPTQPDTLYRTVQIDLASGALAGPETPAAQTQELTVLDLPPQANNWAHTRGYRLLADLPNPPSASGQAVLVMLSPAPNSIYHIASNLPLSAQRLRLEAAGDSDLQHIRLYVDGSLVGAVQHAPYEAWWPLSLGQHTAWAEATRPNGEKVTSQTIIFEVKK